MARRTAALLAELRSAWGDGDWEVGVCRGAGRRLCWVRRGAACVGMGRDLRTALVLALATVDAGSLPPMQGRSRVS
jgi:hypothetical protein